MVAERAPYQPPVNYLLHFDRPLTRTQNGKTIYVYHYHGSTNDLARRLAQHRNAAGNPKAPAIVRTQAERGVGFTVGRLWWGGRDLEAKLKRRNANYARWCAICADDECVIDPDALDFDGE